MEEAPSAPAEAPKAPESEATPTTNIESAQAPDMHGFTSEQLAEMRKFYDANGGFDKVKSKISNPERPVEKPVENSQPQQPVAQPKEEPKYQTPAGAITQEELMAQYYFERLSKKPEYASIADEISGGAVLTEMAKLGIPFRNQDGSWNNDKINDYLDLRAKTVPAKPTESEPNASSAPTVDYITVGDKIENIDQAYQIIMQPNHPRTKDAEEFIKNSLNKK